MLLQLLLSITVIIPAILVLSNHRTASKEILFFLLSVFLSLWVFSNFLIDYDINRSLLWARTTFFAVVLACYFFFEFTLHFPIKIAMKKYSKTILRTLTILVAVLTYTPLFIPETTVDNNVVVVVPGVMYGVFLVFYPAIIFISLYNLWKGHKLASGSDKSRVTAVTLAIIAMTSVTSTTNLILPVFFDYNTLAPFGGYATILFTCGIAYSIMKHKLFDVRGVAARTLAYAGSIGVIVGVYTAVATLTSDFITSQEIDETAQKIVFIVFIGISAVLSSPIKSFFDKVTSELFFRNAYDPQALIDELNKTLVNTVDIESLLTKCALVIQENIKTNYCTFYIRKTSYFPDRIIGAHRRHPEIEHLDRLDVLAPKTNKKIYTVGFGTKSSEENELDKVLISNEFEVMARLISTLDNQTRGIGYIFIGSKRSGTPFSKQDMKVLEIITNELVIAIENILRFEEIEKFNETLQKKIDDATRELRKSNEKLKALDEAKDEFVSMASHQLRTPLTSIKGYLSMVIEGDAGKITPTQKDMLGQAFFSSQRMVYLISDLLNVSRLKTGKFLIEPVPVCLPDVVQSEVEQLRDGAKSKDLTISYAKPETFSRMMLDEMKIRQVIMNFTDNAIYYTPSGGVIQVDLKETKKSVEFTVTDNGIGVPKAQQHKLFAKFYRAENARKTRPDGTGLGLFMAKKVIIAQGGSIIFKSKEGKGSTFGFSFPKEKLLVDDESK